MLLGLLDSETCFDLHGEETGKPSAQTSEKGTLTLRCQDHHRTYSRILASGMLKVFMADEIGAKYLERLAAISRNASHLASLARCHS